MDKVFGDSVRELREGVNTIVMTSLKTDGARDHIIKVILDSNEITEYVKTVSREIFENKSNEKSAKKLHWFSYIIAPVALSGAVTVLVNWFWG